MIRALQKPLKDEYLELRLFRNRVVTGFGIITLVVLLLVLRYVQLQWLQHEDFSTRSNQNRIKLQALPPNRGLIFDRNGLVLAENRPAYRLEVTPERVADMDATLQSLARIIDISDDQLARFERLRSQTQNFHGVPLRFNLQEDELARVAVNQHRYHGVRVVPYLTRYYPHGEVFTHVLGYVGRIDSDDLDDLDQANYRATLHIGKTGVEAIHEARLHGSTGVSQVETNVEGRILKTLSRNDPQPGEDLYLSIDVRLQQAAWDALGEASGAVVAIDPRDGAVLALVSKPSFNPNWFVNGVSQQRYQSILDAPGTPLFNRAVNGVYTPGSTLKPFIALAGLERGLINESSRVFSSGEFRLPGVERPYKDWKRGGHGWVDVRAALEQSVNTYFYSLANDLGIDTLYQYLAQFGFGEPTGIDLPMESRGLLPSREWKRRIHQLPWYPGETVIAGIGQGFNLVTPLQLAAATASLANQGIRFTPRVLRGVHEQPGQPVKWLTSHRQSDVPVTDQRNWQLVQDGMVAVISGAKGTARQAGRGSSYTMAGKTGTAQLFGLQEGETYREEEVAVHLRHDALFIAYAPIENPSIAIAVVAEHGGSGSVIAAPVARAVMDVWLEDDKS